MPYCTSCSLEMKNPADFAAGNSENKFCRHCVDELDELKSYEEIFADQVGFLLQNEPDLTREEAENQVRKKLAQTSTWSEKI